MAYASALTRAQETLRIIVETAALKVRSSGTRRSFTTDGAVRGKHVLG